MATQATAPYGTWTSPITPSLIAEGTLNFNAIHVTPNGNLYLVEGRPAEKGRAVIVQITGDKAHDVLPEKYSASGKIHEYGGGAVSVSPDNSFIFTDGKTSGVFKLNPESGNVEEILSGNEKVRFADFDVSSDGKSIVAVIEEHRDDGKVINSIAVLDTEKKSWKIVVEGADFYSHPRFSPNGKRVAWMQWKNPDMPWTGSEIHVGEWVDGEVKNRKHVAGVPKKQAVCQPRWHFDGDLWFVNDPEGIWQLFKYHVGTGEVEYIHLKGFEDAEIGMREILLGNRSFVPLSKEKLAIAYTRNGTTSLLIYDIPSKSVTALDLSIVQLWFCGIARISDTSFAIIGGTAKTPPALYHVSITKPNEKTLLKSSSIIPLPLETFSPTQTISFPRNHGTPGTSHAIFTPPHNPSFKGPVGTKPPLIVSIHGGPTSHVQPGLSLETQYFTSRGYAYVHVNYTGSTGYGRAYRDALNYNWGIKDIEDTLSCVEFLAEKGLIDKEKVGIRGGSAGGYTVLQALVTHPTFFAAGCSFYGVSNLKSLGLVTHKFEAHYLFDLMFPADTPEDERENIYRERSPCYHAEKIESPLLLLQGNADKVVPLEQATQVDGVLRGLGKDVKLVIYEGEGHGWARGDTIQAAIEEEERLWNRCLL